MMGNIFFTVGQVRTKRSGALSLENTGEDNFKQIALAMFVKDFDSGNGNRDSNMLELLEVNFLKLNTL